MSKIDYSTNQIGPINKTWCDEHGSDWAGGRIDLYGDNLGPYGDEIGLPIMKTEDWYRFSEWLETFHTEKIYSLDKILEQYYKDGNPKIIWFHER